MNRVILLVLLLTVFALPAAASARGAYHHDWSHRSYHRDSWHHTDYGHDRSWNFRWHERRDRFRVSDYRMDRIYDRRWDDRFPGLHAYRWYDRRGEGFWYRGHRITDAVLFYDRSDELVSVGFWHNGAFIFVRDDDDCYESHDSFLIAWHNR